MRFLISILAIIGCAAIYAQTPDDTLVNAAAIVDGFFFDKATPAQSLIPGNSTMIILEDPDGASVIGVYPPEGFVLEESIKAKAIPAKRVKYAEKLLRDYKGRKPQTITG